MKKLYDKNELSFALVWIAIYCALQSFANPLNEMLGIGHIINLFNGSGMDLVSNLCQIIFAIAVGFLLVTIFYRGGSLLPCILVHSAINTLGTFANDTNLTTEMHLLHLAVLIVITIAYTLILTRTLLESQRNAKQA